MDLDDTLEPNTINHQKMVDKMVVQVLKMIIFIYHVKS